MDRTHRHFDDEGWEDIAEGTDRYVGMPGMNAIALAMATGLDMPTVSASNRSSRC